MSSSSRKQDPRSSYSPTHSRRSRRSSGRQDSNSPERRPRSSRQRSTERSRSRRRDRSPSPPARKRCWACGAIPLPDKLVCRDCFRDYASSRELENQQVAVLLEQRMRDSLAELATGNPPQPPLPQAPEMDPVIPGPSTAAASTPLSARPSADLSSEELSEDSIEETDPSGFNFSLVQPFIQAVKSAIAWEEAEEVPQKSKTYFPFLKRRQVFFPLMGEIREVIETEWSKADKRFPMGRLNKLYPFAEEDIQSLSNMPVVDAAVVRLAKNVTLPMEDSASFKDPLDRRLDLDLKKGYLAAGAACRPAIALTSVSHAIRAWTENVETAIRQEVPKEDIIKALEELKLSADFIGEAAIDSIRWSSRSMLHIIMAKRALWLKPWTADLASKQNWCRIPFDGKSLFGEKMEKAISRVTGGKSGMLPQDRRARKSRVVSSKYRPFNSRDSRQTRQFREGKRPWRGTQSTFLSTRRNKTSVSQEQQKPF